jgi:hypothetical protein
MSQSYDPYHLIDDVIAVLEAHDLTPERLDGENLQRLTGASQLLRGLGIDALIPAERALDLDSRYSDIGTE